MNTSAVGFKSSKKRGEVDTDNILQYVTPQDIKSFGLIPELIGRMPVLTYLDPLSTEALKRILSEPKNALIKQYQKLFELDGIELIVEDSAIDYIVEKAEEYGLGARGLRTICEAIFNDDMFNLPSEVEEGDKRELRVDRKYAVSKLSKLSDGKLKAAS